MFIDGVYRSRSASQIGDLVDVQRIEVLRGPQSTLFGQNASAGVISVITRQPSFSPGGSVELGLGDYNSRLIKARYTGPISERVAFSITAGVDKRDGHFANLANGHSILDCPAHVVTAVSIPAVMHVSVASRFNREHRIATVGLRS